MIIVRVPHIDSEFVAAVTERLRRRATCLIRLVLLHHDQQTRQQVGAVAEGMELNMTADAKTKLLVV